MAGLTTAEKVARWAGRMSLVAFLVWILSWRRLGGFTFAPEAGERMAPASDGG